MNWILIFWLNTPVNYQVHSDHITRQDCQKQEKFYDNVFSKTNSQLVATCKPALFAKHIKPKGDLIYYKETIR